MGRLFEYNRFNNDKDISKGVGGNERKDKEFIQKSRATQTKAETQKYETLICPSYSELYAENVTQLSEDTTKRTQSAKKSVEIAIKKYHQLSKYLIQSQDEEKDDCEMIGAAVAPPKKPRVYDCMRDFLRKKFFHHNAAEESAEYDEDDYLSMMESYDIKDTDEDEDDDDECLLVVASSRQTRSRCNHLVEGGCWSCIDEEEDDGDSDGAIKDCCQLLRNSCSPKKEKTSKSPKRKSIDLPSDLRDASWFQPNISGKIAVERLNKEAPGTFIVRQSTSLKPGNFILCLRMETKVKKFVILGSPRCYKIKGAKKEFSSLKALVTHHSVMAEQLPVTLVLPRSADEKVSHRYLDDFDTFESLQILGILKILQSQNLELS